ncbi:MAG: hypothetical protein NVS4B2_19030 [Chloroflexota bacterium]
MLLRFTIWLTSAAAVFALDALTKAGTHPVVAYNHAHTPAVVLVVVGILLLALGLVYSLMLALGAGLMFGGLLGNGGELIRYGYASDWIHVGHYLTNIADLAGGVGLICCLVGYAIPRRL